MIYNTIYGLIKGITQATLNTAGDQSNPVVAVVENPLLSSIRIVFAFVSNRLEDTDGTTVIARMLNSDYTVFKEAFIVNTYFTKDQRDPRIVYLKNTEGKFAIIYSSD